MSVSDDLIVISDRSSSIFLISLARCLEPGLSLVIPSSSPLMVSLVSRVLHTYTSGGDILDIRAGVVTIVFGVNMHGRDQVEGRVIIQVRMFFVKSVDTLN